MPYQVLHGSKIPIKIYVDDLAGVESGALDQLRNCANLPWVEDIVAMPDVHWGNGATVGSVILNNGAISPSVVGVDIGCFPGDTEIPVLDGKAYAIKHLADSQESFFVYACTPSGRIRAAKATAFKTRTNASLVKITLDNKKEVTCTPDHKFMLRDSSYCEAKDLVSGISLMPLYLEFDRDGYPMVIQPELKDEKAHPWERVSWVVANSNLLGEIPSYDKYQTIIHHRNENKEDNRPSNLEFMSSSEHSSHHVEERKLKGTWHWQNPSFEDKRKAAISAKAKTPEGYKYFAEKVNKINEKMRINPDKREDWLQTIKDNGKRGSKYLKEYNEKVNKVIYTCSSCLRQIKGLVGFINHRRRTHGIRESTEASKAQSNYTEVLNHKVVKVENLTTVEDVYCLNVPQYNNFALSAGVFVHNCGMSSVKTPFTAHDLKGDKSLKELRTSIERSIPVGHLGNAKISSRVSESLQNLGKPSEMADPFIDKARTQLGSLGGGNHFVEVCLDKEDNIWVMLHSGSRNIGKELATRHIRKAKGVMADVVKRFGSMHIEAELAALLVGSKEYNEYLYDLFWCQSYARANRDEMMTRVLKDVSFHFRKEDIGEKKMTLMRVDCHHNYIESVVLPDGRQAILTRKGAVSAKEGEFGIIPGSMGAKSFIVRGKGNPESYCSCSHGAGRKMSRTAAKKQFTVEDLADQTDGVECRKDLGVVDEIPGAYKDIDWVMAQQSDLVDIVAELKQVLCVKG